MRIRHYSFPLSLCAALPLAAVAVEDKPEGFIEGSSFNVLARNFTSTAMIARASPAPPATATPKPGPRV